MILVDISGLLHKAIFNATKNLPQQQELHRPETYKKVFLDSILNELIETQTKYRFTFGELVICFDYKGSDSYWRKDIYPAYKAQRKLTKTSQPFDYNDVYEMFEELKVQLESNTPWKCVTAERAEADDVILVLSREIAPKLKAKTLIYSADKDMIQAQYNNPKIEQYSHQTKKWLLPEDKYDDMSHWFLEHQCLGDLSDNVFNIVHNTEFSDNFKFYLKTKNIDECYHEVYKFRELDLELKKELLLNYNVFKKLKANQETPDKDIYKTIRFGPSGLKKSIDKHGSLENFLNTNPIIKENFERNYILVMEDGIPEYVKENILMSYTKAKSVYNKNEFVKYLTNEGLFQIIQDLPTVFTEEVQELTIENCGW